eukprot:TRINITY_DN7525_c0_g1_i4.p1 TRINITY_DN7525_c0_g1~~TRINITY_DN7525_c0_g1_i4.p1  ORF type:complete len:404 (-),score=45.75 TRINITY_DN7525_c0_g1_i4:186-1397(-)
MSDLSVLSWNTYSRTIGGVSSMKPYHKIITPLSTVLAITSLLVLLSLHTRHFGNSVCLDSLSEKFNYTFQHDVIHVLVSSELPSTVMRVDQLDSMDLSIFQFYSFFKGIRISVFFSRCIGFSQYFSNLFLVLFGDSCFGNPLIRSLLSYCLGYDVMFLQEFAKKFGHEGFLRREEEVIDLVSLKIHLPSYFEIMNFKVRILFQVILTYFTLFYICGYSVHKFWRIFFNAAIDHRLTLYGPHQVLVDFGIRSIQLLNEISWMILLLHSVCCVSLVVAKFLRMSGMSPPSPPSSFLYLTSTLTLPPLSLSFSSFYVTSLIFSVRSKESQLFFPRSFGVFVIAYLLYFFTFPHGYIHLALFVLLISVETIIVITLVSFELPAIERGDISLHYPRFLVFLSFVTSLT